jgi:DNA topoisomerase-6 subunit A
MFLKRLNKELNLPTFTLVDSDPYGHYIHSVYLRGSKRLSYESPFLATPNIKLLGVLTRDLDKYKIPTEARIKMNKQDEKRTKDLLQEDFVKTNKAWEMDLKLALKKKEKAEIQAFASHGFKFLTDDYLPEKLTTGDWI